MGGGANGLRNPVLNHVHSLNYDLSNLQAFYATGFSSIFGGCNLVFKKVGLELLVVFIPDFIY